MLTPEGISPIEPSVSVRPLAAAASVGQSASPLLRPTCDTMKRTPQPTLTQSKFQEKSKGPADDPGINDAGVDARRTLTLEDVEMEPAAVPPPAPTPAHPAPPTPAASQYLTTDLFLKTLKEHTDQIIMSFNANINAVSHRIDGNAAKIGANSSAIASQGELVEAQQSDISSLERRVSKLEKRHIKFDDFRGTLFTNVKLPGDTKWTRVTAAMAREDLEASIKEESVSTQRRLVTKLLPGPRERLSKPMSINRNGGRPAITDGTAASYSENTGRHPLGAGSLTPSVASPQASALDGLDLTGCPCRDTQRAEVLHRNQ